MKLCLLNLNFRSNKRSDQQGFGLSRRPPSFHRIHILNEYMHTNIQSVIGNQSILFSPCERKFDRVDYESVLSTKCLCWPRGSAGCYMLRIIVEWMSLSVCKYLLSTILLTVNTFIYTKLLYYDARPICEYFKCVILQHILMIDILSISGEYHRTDNTSQHFKVISHYPNRCWKGFI